MEDKINKIVSDYFKIGKFDEALEKNVTQCLEKILDDSFRSHGDISKQIEEELKERLKLDFSKMELPEFNNMIVDLVKAKTVGTLDKLSQSILAEELEKMLSPAPDKVDVQFIVDMVREANKEECACDYDSHVTVDLDSDGWSHRLKIWADKRFTTSFYDNKERENDPDVDITIHKEDKTIGIIFSGDVKKHYGTSNFDVHAQLFLMYCSKTVIEDINELDVNYLETNLYEYD